MIFFASKILAWVYERHRNFFGGGREKNRGIFIGCEKRLRDCFGYAKKGSGSFG